MTTANEGFKRAANSPAGRQAADTAKEIGEDVANFADDVSRKASQQFTRAQDMATDVYDTAHAAVRRDPLTAIAIAVGMGLAWCACGNAPVVLSDVLFLRLMCKR